MRPVDDSPDAEFEEHWTRVTSGEYYQYEIDRIVNRDLNEDIKGNFKYLYLYIYIIIF